VPPQGKNAIVTNANANVNYNTAQTHMSQLSMVSNNMQANTQMNAIPQTQNNSKSRGNSYKNTSQQSQM
jgi:hypothetical protein